MTDTQSETVATPETEDRPEADTPIDVATAIVMVELASPAGRIDLSPVAEMSEAVADDEPPAAEAAGPSLIAETAASAEDPGKVDPDDVIIVDVAGAAAAKEAAGGETPLPPQPEIISITPSEPGRQQRILAIANQKGGVGKTTTAINLGTALAAAGEHVLIVDLDPQGNASTGLGIDRRDRRTSTYDVLTGGAPMREAVLATAVPQLFIAPSTLDLTGFELEVGGERDRAFRLRQALRELGDDARTYDFSYVLVDCPPSLNLLTVNAMAAADAILVPLQCEFFALEGLSQLLKTVDQVKTTLNPKLSIHGIVLTMYDSRNNLSAQVVADVREFMGSKVYDTVIPRNVRVSEAPSYGKPVLVYDLKCVGSEAYLRLATEVIQREKELQRAG
jgi:chromosome partitioning protein